MIAVLSDDALGQRADGPGVYFDLVLAGEFGAQLAPTLGIGGDHRALRKDQVIAGWRGTHIQHLVDIVARFDLQRRADLAFGQFEYRLRRVERYAEGFDIAAPKIGLQHALVPARLAMG